MGGHAFENLHCPRIPPEVYAKIKHVTTLALQTVFTHVTVPFEVPGKADYGDIDFLPVIDSVKRALDTTHGRRGFLTPDCMYFAMPLPADVPTICVEDEDESREREGKLWVQVDVKICFKPEMFLWMSFELNFASQSSILGSMIKPLGLTLDPEGLHIRVEEMEASNWAGSIVFVTKDPWLVSRILGLGRRVIDGGFENSEEVYEEYARSWLFHPETFRAKLEDESYIVQHSHRAQFLKKWIPERYPGYKLDMKQEDNLVPWTARTRRVVRERVFTRFSDVAIKYYVKRSQHAEEVEERKLRQLITSAIPTGTDGWSDDFDLPPVVVKQPTSKKAPGMPARQAAVISQDVLTPPSSPVQQAVNPSTTLPDLFSSYPYRRDTPVYIEALPRQPPYSCKPGPPPQSMSAAARLACLARWTAFSATGTPYLLTSPCPKNFDLQWRDTIEAGFSAEGLVNWAQEIWWIVWVRQCVVNWRGMWAKRFEKENAKVKKARKEAEEKAGKESIEEEARVKAEELVRVHKLKIMGRLEGLNRALGLLDVQE